jgi:hypothetical protein
MDKGRGGRRRSAVVWDRAWDGAGGSQRWAAAERQVAAACMAAALCYVWTKKENATDRLARGWGKGVSGTDFLNSSGPVTFVG